MVGINLANVKQSIKLDAIAVQIGEENKVANFDERSQRQKAIHKQFRCISYLHILLI
jgi:hypothetical protein